MSYTYYKKASWNAICQACQFKFKAEDIKLRWDGLRVCPTCYEVRHPQDFIKIKGDTMTPPWTSPRPNDVFVEVPYIIYITDGYVDMNYFEDTV